LVMSKRVENLREGVRCSDKLGKHVQIAEDGKEVQAPDAEKWTNVQGRGTHGWAKW